MNVVKLFEGERQLTLVLVPARVLEAVVESGHPLSVLEDHSAMINILNRDDLLFYKGVNYDITKLVPKEVLDAVGYHCDNTHRKCFGLPPAQYVAEDIYPFNDHQEEDTFSRECGVYMETNYPGTVSANAHFIAHCKSNDVLTHSSTLNVNNYVGQYFAISPTTIGVTLTVTDAPRVGLRKAVEGLLALLYDDYLTNADVVTINGTPLATVERNSFCLQKLSYSGLVAFYCSLLPNK